MCIHWLLRHERSHLPDHLQSGRLQPTKRAWRAPFESAPHFDFDLHVDIDFDFDLHIDFDFDFDMNVDFDFDFDLLSTGSAPA